MSEEIIEPKYCSKEIGEILYRDKLMSISKYEPVSNLLRKYNKNYEYNEKVIKEFQAEKNKRNILEFIPINNLGYDEKYLESLSNINTTIDMSNNLRLCNGIFL